jgi:hypothetical protein
LWSSRRDLQVGDVLKRDGQEWLVVDVRTDTDGNTAVTLRTAGGSDGEAA